jgi:hypothetical protein
MCKNKKLDDKNWGDIKKNPEAVIGPRGFLFSASRAGTIRDTINVWANAVI